MAELQLMHVEPQPQVDSKALSLTYRLPEGVH
jgi:hypothetical protein